MRRIISSASQQFQTTLYTKQLLLEIHKKFTALKVCEMLLNGLGNGDDKKWLSRTRPMHKQKLRTCTQSFPPEVWIMQRRCRQSQRKRESMASRCCARGTFVQGRLISTLPFTLRFAVFSTSSTIMIRWKPKIGRHNWSVKCSEMSKFRMHTPPFCQSEAGDGVKSLTERDAAQKGEFAKNSYTKKVTVRS